MAETEHSSDTRIGEQSALRTSTGRSWLIMGALFAVVSGGLLLVLSSRQPAIGYLGAGIIAVQFLLMVIIAIVVKRVRKRLVTLAVILATMAATAIIFVLLVITAEWAALL